MMNKFIIVVCCCILVYSTDCFSDTVNKNKVSTRAKHVYGRSSDFSNFLYLGISFIKDINPTDTTYYIKFKLYAPDSEFCDDICFNKAKSISFLAKNGNIIDLKMNAINALTESSKQFEDPFKSVQIDNYSTSITLKITKEKLIELGAHPFYKLILPYYNNTSKVNNKLVFIRPTVFTRRIFIQKKINDILEN